jgi:hypothetical protein
MNDELPEIRFCSAFLTILLFSVQRSYFILSLHSAY